MRTHVDLGLARGHWVAPQTIAWPRDALPPGVEASDLEWTLHCSPDGGIDLDRREPYPWTTIPLRVVSDGGLPTPLVDEHPHLSGAITLGVPPRDDLAELLRGQVVVTARRPNRELVDASGVQFAPILDQLYGDAVRARLGVSWGEGVPTLKVWAPTAHQVDLLLWEAGRSLEDSPERVPMRWDADGTWAATGHANWVAARYLYAVTVFAPSFGRVVENRVTDPYSIGLTLNSTHSLVLDLDDPALAPDLWADTPVPPLRHPVDQVVYELHVRDFSRADKTVPDALRGTFAAFACDSDGTRHLRRLAEAGLTSVQLLPIFDYSSVEEDPCRRTAPDVDVLKAAAPDSAEQQQHVAATEKPSFNWGYDPWHHQVPEGSLCTEAAVQAGGRVREARLMVGALHRMGLLVVLDQVYNHTDGEGQGGTSVLGRIVPGYYHRRDEVGAVARSTCCPNVATEHAMAGKLMVDSVVHWVRHYHVDGFRFDLMGHHSRDNMLAVRAALDALTPERDGVDGRAVTLYGEGWDFGEVAGNARFVQATQGQLDGTQIATFSDRLRDAVRGGGPFDEDPRRQGYATGLAGAPNGTDANGSPAQQRDRLLGYTDIIQLGLAGNLRDFSFNSARTRRPIRGDQVPYKGVLAAGYAAAPDEVITYVDAHDNETLFDALTLKLPVDLPMAQRVRFNTLALAVATLGQSPVMWHAGTDFLRSKSLDRNSYTSGDWFNYLDFTLTDNGFGAGLPPAADNADKWVYMKPLLADERLKPGPDDMRLSHAVCLELLRLRASSRLFRLADPAQVHAKVSFPVSGSWAQTDGVVVMVLDDRAGEPVDDRFASITVVFNANPWPVRQLVPPLVGRPCARHPVQAGGADPTVREARCDDGQFSVPGITAAVFVEQR